MAPFLTLEWIERLHAAANADPALVAEASGVSLTVQQIVSGSDGETAWFVRFVDGEIDIAPGMTHDADVVIRESLDTATSISRGELSPADALASGCLEIAGDIGALVRHQAVLARLRDALAAVHEHTTYPLP